MSRPLTDEQRLRIVDACRHAASIKAVARSFGVGEQSVRRALAALAPDLLREMGKRGAEIRNRNNRERGKTDSMEGLKPKPATSGPCLKWLRQRGAWEAVGAPETEPEARLAVLARTGEAGLSAALRAGDEP